MSERPITQLLHALADGDEDSGDRLLDAVYEELKGLARAKVARERPGFTLSASDLVHEAYLRLQGEDALHFDHRRHFFGAAAEAMRRILVEHERARRATERGGDRERVPLETVEVPAESRDLDLTALSVALGEFRALDARAHEVVQLRYFLGLSVDDTAEVIEITPRAVEQEWRAARLWLKRRMQELADSPRDERPDGASQ